MAIDYRIVLSDREFVVQEILDRLVYNISFGYSRNGGCGQFKFEMDQKYCRDLLFGANYNVKIYRRNPTTKSYELKYQGRIEDKEHSVKAGKESVSVTGFGYQSSLSDIIINQTFTSMSIENIVKSILDNHVVPNTDITYSASDIDATGITLDTFVLNYQSAAQALQTLAETAGSREFGVNKNRQFIFKARSETVGYNYPLEKLINFSMRTTSKDIKNRVIVVGSGSSGSQFVFSKDYAQSQLKYKRRDAILQRSAVNSNSVATELADAANAEFDDVSFSIKFTLREETFFEDTTPIPLINIITREVTYDELNYDDFLYAGLEPFQISRIDYKILKSGELESTIQAGPLSPTIVEKMGLLNFNLDQVRQGA